MENSPSNKSMIFCDTPIWDQNLIWFTNSPQLTECFTQTVLPVIPLIVLIGLLPYDLYVVRSIATNLPPIPYQWKNKLILLSVICLSIIEIINISKTLRNYFSNEINLLIISELFSPLIKLITYLLVTRLVLYFRKYGYKHSVSLPILWLCSLFIVSLEVYRVFITNNKNINILTEVLKCLELLFTSKVLIISCLTPKTSQFVSLNTESHSFCPMSEYNVFSRIYYLWLRKILLNGYKANKDLTPYLQPICPSLQSETTYKLFCSADKKYNTNSLANKRLFPLIWSTAWAPYLVGLLLTLLQIISEFFQPYILAKLIDFISGTDPYRWHGIFYAFAYTFFNIIARLFEVHSWMYLITVAFRMRTALTSAVYDKIFKLSAESRREYTTGEINNLMGVDIQEVSTICRRSFNFFAIPISISIGVYLLWQYLGPSSLTLFVVTLAVSPLTTFVSKRMNKFQTIQMSLKDKRMEQLSEILNNIKLLKLFGWEKPFIARVTQTRAQELNKQLVVIYYLSAIVVLWIVIPMFTAGITFTMFTLFSGQALTAKTAFVTLSLFSIVGFPIARIPDLLISSVRAFVSYKRIRNYLSSEELEENHNNNSGDDLDDSVITLNGCSFAWSNTEEPILKNINLNIKKGSLVAIVGRVGSGKSSLFSALLGDMYRFWGDECRVTGSVAYVPQTAWIQNISLRQNILFVSEYQKEKYERVVDSCALKSDFDFLPARDLTEIGEKGINLSGGQKHRVSLARAVYQDSDIYLLDDPLSAVDAYVGQHLFKQVIGPNGLLAQKTRILATHSISFLTDVEQIIVMDDGNIIGTGTYDELKAQGLLSAHVLDDLDNTSLSSEDIQQNNVSNEATTQILRQMSKQSDSSSLKYQSFKEMAEKDKQKAQLIEEEKQNYGNVGLRVYMDYFRRCGIFIILVSFFFGIVFNVSEVGGNYYLNIWSSQNSTQIQEPSNKRTFLAIYLSAVFLKGITVAISQVLFRYGGINAAAQFHKSMLFSVIRAPMSFFDTTPMGRIINRFNRDINNIDESIPFNGWECMTMFILFATILAVIVYTSPLMIIQIVIVFIVFVIIYRFYLWTSRQLRRLDATTRSPVYSHFNESIVGAVSIRAYDVQKIFLQNLQNLLDININVNKHIFSTINWIEIWISMIGTVITLSISLVIVLNKDMMTPGLAGFMLFYSVEMVKNFYLLRRGAELENSMVSVERIDEYSQLSSEADWDSSPECKPGNNWPKTAKIEFVNYTTSYREGLDPVLKNLNFTIESGEKVGIVGRTGAGKTSITLALFRIIEPTIGQIFIDGMDITQIGLHDLRSKITIIPQEPNLFAGTLRLNLDPFNEYTDQMLWSALKSAHLMEFFRNTSDGLSYDISEGGDNLSGGQRQLVCLARALLRQTKILVLDEATAACDLETDRLIQNTIKEKFNDWTVITIAHRLNTVLDYNKIIVLENGVIVEMDSPNNLLKNTDSVFYGLAKEFGIV